MFDLFGLEFMQRAFFAGIVLAPVLSVLGSFSTLRKMSFFADGIAHASLFGVALALIAGLNPFFGALIIGLIFGLIVFFVERYTNINSDAVIGILFTTGLALGIILISLQPGYQPDLISFLFGNILTISWQHVWIICVLGLMVLVLVKIYFRKITFTSLSEDLAWTSGIATHYIDFIFYILLSLAVVLGVKLLGIILVSSLLITPAVTSKIITRSFRSYILVSVAFSLLSFVCGLFISYHFDLPSGATIVVVSSIIFFIILLIKNLIFKPQN